MSILIKNVEMPKNCANCRMWACCPALPEREWPDFESILLNDVIGDGGTRDSNCPLIPVLPHGRLIDAEQPIKEIEDAIENIDQDFPLLDFNSRYCMERGLRMAKIFLKTAPTIIPADKEEEE